MIELIEEIDTATNLLSVALERYLGACSAIQTYYKRSNFTGVPQSLVDRISKELLSITSYETRMKRAKSLISGSMNCPSTVASIHSLPPESLIRIFEFAVDARPCGVKARDNSGNKTSLPKYPDFLAHVCSRWRRVAIGFPALWSHIDIVRYHSLSQGYINRAEVFAHRADPLPLEIHLRIPASHDSTPVNWRNYLNFLRNYSNRIRSLELAIPSTADGFDDGFLSDYMLYCTPGTLVQLSITVSGFYTPCFLGTSKMLSTGVGQNIVRITFPPIHFADTLLHVTALQLEGAFFPWTSQAYHGLIELRLTTNSATKVLITQSELHHILTSSPQLRIVEFGLEIVDRPFESQNDSTIQPVPLKDLELLNLDALDHHQLGLFLALLTPTSTPLRITIRYHVDDPPPPAPLHNDKVLEFLARSNIATLRVGNMTSYSDLEELLTLLPHLQVLVLDNLIHSAVQETALESPGDSTLHSPSCLSVLYILSGETYVDWLRNILEKHPVQKLVFWGGVVRRSTDRFTSYDQDEVRAELSNVCPVIERISTREPCPMDFWD